MGNSSAFMSRKPMSREMPVTELADGSVKRLDEEEWGGWSRKAETFEPVTITCAATAAANAAGRSSLTGKGRRRGRSSRFASKTGRGEKDCPLWGNLSC